MIGRLRGAVGEVSEEEALIDVMGVGYVVRCGARTLSRLPALGEETLLHIESQWSESQGLRLYGFSTRDERRAFVALQAIQGVGPKAAMAVLDVLPPAELTAAVARDDKAAIGRANGVGPKLAARIAQELKGKPLSDGPISHGEFASAEAHAAPPPSIAGEAVVALMGLGVAEALARRHVEAALARLGDGVSISDLIKAALQEIGR